MEPYEDLPPFDTSQYEPFDPARNYVGYTNWLQRNYRHLRRMAGSLRRVACRGIRDELESRNAACQLARESARLSPLLPLGRLG